MQPAISVVLPTYQRAHLVERAISSVLHQRFANWELIVVDDGSTDGTADVVERCADPRVSVVRLHRNVGVAAARNAGLRVVRAPVVAFLDSDDVYLPNALGDYLQALEAHPEALAVEGLSLDAPTPVPGHQIAGRSRRDVIAHAVAPHVQAVAVRTDRGAAVRFDPHLRRGEDRQFGVDLLDQGPVVGFARPVTRYLPQPDGLSAGGGLLESGERFFRRHEAEIRRDPELLGQWLRRLASRGFDDGDVARARGYLRIAGGGARRDPRPRILLALSYVQRDPFAFVRRVRRVARLSRRGPAASVIARAGRRGRAGRRQR